MSDCRDIESLLSPYLDGELDGADRERVDEHLAGCDRCRETVSAWRDADSVLAASPPARSDVEWERLARRVEDAIGDEEDEVEQVRLGAAAAGGTRSLTRPTEATAQPAASPPRRRLPGPLWAVGSGALAAAALVALFWPMLSERTGAPRPEPVPVGRGLASREDAASSFEVPAAGEATGETDPARLDEAIENLEALGYVEDGPAPQSAPETSAPSPPPPAEVAAPSEAGTRQEKEEAPVLAERARAAKDIRATAPDGATSLAQVIAWLEPAADAREGAAEPAGRAAQDVRVESPGLAAQRKIQGLQAATDEDEDAVTPDEVARAALLRAHELRDAGRDDEALAGYRLLAGDFPDNPVREEAWYALTEMLTQRARAEGAGLAAAEEAAARLEGWLETFPDSDRGRGARSNRLLVWGRLTELDPAYCAGADRVIAEWQEGQEMVRKDLIDEVEAIRSRCSP